jgi:hypothetical protein
MCIIPDGSSWDCECDIDADCPADMYCINGMCKKKPTRILLGPLELSFSPWCSERFIGKPFCVGNEVWKFYRDSRCGIKPRFVQKCIYGCYNGVCKSASQYKPPYLPRITQRRISETCEPKWVCLNNHWKAYRTRNCSYIAKTYCKNGCKNGYCKPKMCIIPDGSSWDCECDIDADCPADMYCQQRAGPDACVPIKDYC